MHQHQFHEISTDKDKFVGAYQIKTNAGPAGDFVQQAYFCYTFALP